MRVLVLLLLLSACDSAPATPHARIEHFTGCPVPSNAVQLHDHIGGDANRAVTHAKLVLPKEGLRAFLRGCGTTLEALEPAYDASATRPTEALDFWTLPDRQLIRGGERVRPGLSTVIVLHERDTDIAIYLWGCRDG